ncbi:MAG: S9 family peptidase [Bacteroidia bacterium]
MRKIIVLCLNLLIISAFAQKRDVELSDIWASGVFFPKSISGFVNLSDGSSYCIQSQDEAGNSTVESYDYQSGDKKGVLIDGARIAKNLGLEKFNFGNFQLASDESVALLEYDSEAIYRHSTRAMAIVVNLSDYSIVEIKGGKVRYPTLDPTASRVAYVKDNDLYIYDLVKGKLRRVTKDGAHNQIINGAVDWVYEEEFGMSRGFEWNVDGSKIAYYRFDESAVKQWVMPMYGDLYPEQYTFKYPKAGEANSIVDVYICDVLKGKDKKIELGSENDQYLPRIKWTNNADVLSVQRLNRLQNKWELLMVTNGEVNVSLEETNKYYVDITDDIFFLNDGKHMIVKSEKNGYNHLYFHKLDGPQVFQITKGKWGVDHVLGIDEKNEIIYYTSTENSAIERQIYSISFEGKNKTQLSSGSGFHTAKFSKDFSLALHTHNRAETGMVYTIRDNAWSTVRVVEDNQEFKDRLSEFNLSPLTFSTLTTENGDELNYWMIKPSNMDSGKKYPMLMYVYGGPGSQTVKDQFMYSNYFWFQMLANKHGVIIASVDNRGTGARGEEFKKMTYKQLGKYETEDQISAAKVLGQMEDIDEDRIGIWGWSYGGYMSSLALAKGNEVFKMAIAVAPVSNWRYYDNIYTERYMQRPQENAEGYDQNSPINFVKDIKGAYLIVHGTGDDNVHFQNTVEMVNELIKYNIEFDSEFYPNKNHGIYGGYTRYHLFNRMTNFVLEEL